MLGMYSSKIMSTFSYAYIRVKYFFFKNSISRKYLCFPQRPYYTKNTLGTGINNSSFYWIRDGKMRCTRLRRVIHSSFLRKKWLRKIADFYKKKVIPLGFYMLQISVMLFSSSSSRWTILFTILLGAILSAMQRIELLYIIPFLVIAYNGNK